MFELCPTCLSQDRNLFTLDKGKYAAIFGHQIIMNTDSVCWECITMFRKLHKFKLQVLKAQELFNRRTLVPLAPLTHLTFSKIDNFTVCCNLNEHIKDEVPESETDLPLEIKTENEFEDEVTTENDFEDEIKTENNFEDTSTSVNDDQIANMQSDTAFAIDIIKDEHEYYNKTITEYTKNHEQKVTKDQKKLDIRKTNDKIDNRASVKKQIIEKDNFTVEKMTEDEMLAKRDRDRERVRYKKHVKFRCDSCIFGYFQEHVYEKHMKTKHSESAGRHVCMICKTRFTKIFDCQAHIESHYIKYQCKICSYVGYKLDEMVSHDAKEHNVLRFICEVCDVEFASPFRLRFHRGTQHGEPLKCESCPRVFSSRNALRVHTRQKHNNKGVVMPKIPCTVGGTRVRYMKSHMRQHSAVPEAAYCAECDKRFKSIENYKSHLKYAVPHRSPDVLK